MQKDACFLSLTRYSLSQTRDGYPRDFPENAANCVIKGPEVEKQLNIQEVKRLIGEIQQIVGEQETDLPTLTGLADELWDYTDLMRYFRISLSTVKRRRRDKTFKGFPIGSRFYYLKSEILKIPKALITKR